jgi:hypothetical protein
MQKLALYADDVNLLADKIDTLNKNTETLTDASKEIDLEVKAKKTEYKLHHLFTRVQGQIKTLKIVTDPLKLWLCLNILDHLEQNNV